MDGLCSQCAYLVYDDEMDSDVIRHDDNFCCYYTVLAFDKQKAIAAMKEYVQSMATSAQESFEKFIKNFVKEKQDEYDLRELHRLKADTRNTDPPGRAVDRIAHKTNGRQHEDIQNIEDPIELHDPGKIEQGDDHHHGNARDDARKLLVPQ